MANFFDNQIANELTDKDQNENQQRAHQSHIGLESIVAPGDGQIAQTTGSYSSRHGGEANDIDDGQGAGPNDSRQTFF